MFLQIRQMPAYGALEPASVLNPVEPFLILVVVVPSGQETVTFDTSRRIQNKLVELHKAKRESLRLRFGQYADAHINFGNVAFIYGFDFLGQLAIAAGQF